MEALINWFVGGSVSSSITMILLAFVLATIVSIYLIAFLQGREISFWPPKIGERKKQLNKKDDKISPDEQTINQIHRRLRHVSQMVENILQFQISDKLDRELGIKLDLTDSARILEPEEAPPENEDFPYIHFFSIDRKSVKLGDVVNVLFRVVDEGLNFSHSASNAFEIMDTSNMIIFPAKPVGRGYYFSQIHFPENATLGYHKITFKLTDTDNNSFTQSLKIQVEKV